MRRSLLPLPLCLFVIMLTGCGQKGPLVLPPVKPAAAPNAAKPLAPAPAASSATPASQLH